MRTKLLSLITIACISTILHAEFKAGFARVDATPPLGIPMIGYFKHRKAKGVLDPLCIECVAVSDGKNAALIYSVDDVHLIGPFLDKAFPDITAATGVPRDRIFIHSTHTHTGPACGPRWYFTKEQNRITSVYAEMRRTRLVDAGKMALADLKPSTMAIARTECKNISFIRRFRMKDGTVRTNPGRNNPNISHPLAKPDESVQLIRFKRKDAPDIAIVNFGTHTDTVGGELLSADWPGVFRKTFETGIGDGVKCLFLNGAQGDANHIDVRPSPGRKSLSRKLIHKHIGRALAGAAMSIWDICEDVPTGKVGGMANYITFPANTPTADEIKWVKMFDEGRAKEIPLTGMEIKTISHKGSRVRKLMNGPKEFKILVSNVSIGDTVAFSGMPCEPFVSIGTDVKKHSPFRMTIVTSLTNGSEGYIPSTSAHKDGGYEALSTRFAAPTGDMLVATQLKQLNQLKSAAESKKKTKRFVSYNIHHARGADQKVDLLRVAGVIGRASPDVIGLNEVDRNAQRSGNIDIATELGKLTGLHATFAKAIPLGGGSYGNAVLSKEKPLCVKRFPLPGSEPRVLLFCEFEDYWFGTMHLALKLPEQKKSMEIVKREIANLKTEKPIFLSGDWNCRPKSAPLDQIREDMTIISKENGCTFTNFKKDASETEPCIDYIAVNKKHADDITVKDAYIVSDAITSDHNPVVVVLEMPIKTSGGNAGPVQR